MAVDWKKVGLVAATGGLAATPTIAKHVADVSGGKKEGVFGYDASRDESRRVQRWERKAERGNSKKARKLAQYQAYQEGKELTGKATPEQIEETLSPYMEQLSAAENQALKTALEAQAGGMTPEAKRWGTTAGIYEATKGKAAAGSASIIEMLHQRAAAEKAANTALILSEGKADAEMSMALALAAGQAMSTSGASEHIKDPAA